MSVRLWNHDGIRAWNQPVLSNNGEIILAFKYFRGLINSLVLFACGIKCQREVLTCICVSVGSKFCLYSDWTLRRDYCFPHTVCSPCNINKRTCDSRMYYQIISGQNITRVPICQPKTINRRLNSWKYDKLLYTCIVWFCLSRFNVSPNRIYALYVLVN